MTRKYLPPLTPKPLDRQHSVLKTTKPAMLLKMIYDLRYIFIFVVPSMLISSPANAQLAVADGKYFGWEESITVKSRKVVSCGGWLFDQYDGTPASFAKCKEWRFATSNPSVIKATSISGEQNVYYFCLPPKVEIPRASCGPNGWQKRPTINR
jgi:hypothetical protein